MICQGQIKLIDFGLSKNLNKPELANQKQFLFSDEFNRLQPLFRELQWRAKDPERKLIFAINALGSDRGDKQIISIDGFLNKWQNGRLLIL